MTAMAVEPGEWIIAGHSSNKYARELAAINTPRPTNTPTHRVERAAGLTVYVPIRPVKP